MKKLPAYQVVSNALEKDIRNGIHPVGALIPSESDLEKIYQVSRTTIRKAIELLVDEGLVSVQQGRGTLVLDFLIDQNISEVSSLTLTLIEKGYDVSCLKCHVERVEADEKTAFFLNLDVGTELFRIQRIQGVDGRPFAYITNYIEATRVPGFEEYCEEIVSLYQFLQTKYGIELEGTVDKISAISADFLIASVLNVKEGSALLEMNRVSVMNDKPATYDLVIVPGDQYQYTVDLLGFGRKGKDFS